MKQYTIVWEINSINGDTPLEAVREGLKCILDKDALQFYAIDEKTGEKFSVDLNEDDEDAVLQIKE